MYRARASETRSGVGARLRFIFLCVAENFYAPLFTRDLITGRVVKETFAFNLWTVAYSLLWNAPSVLCELLDCWSLKADDV